MTFDARTCRVPPYVHADTELSLTSFCSTTLQRAEETASRPPTTHSRPVRHHQIQTALFGCWMRPNLARLGSTLFSGSQICVTWPKTPPAALRFHFPASQIRIPTAGQVVYSYPVALQRLAHLHCYLECSLERAAHELRALKPGKHNTGPQNAVFGNRPSLREAGILFSVDAAAASQ